ncbi:MAG: DNA polymerase III subunit delta [Muribaculaceae bacterium]|nr:DNA polymerase III subunit delta [Muribaculaceae bacterium]
MPKNDNLSFQQICQATRSKKFVPIYLLMGEEPYYIDEISNLVIKEALSEDEKDFNLTEFYGLEADVRQVINTCRRFPMMAEHQVVIIREAQMMAEIDLLKHYVEKPLESTILLICHKGGKIKAPETLKILKTSDSAIIFESKPLTDKNVEVEINAYAKEQGLTINPKAVSMLHDFVGTDIANLHLSLNKLSLVVPQGKEITPDIIEYNIGISKDYNSYELLDAIKKRNAEKALRIVKYYKSDPSKHPVQPITSMIFNFFQKALLYKTVRDRSEASLMAITESKSSWQFKYFVQDASMFSPRDCFFAIGWLRNLDTMSKGVNSYQNPYELLQDTILKIIYNKS